jgi:glycyl-tRNA synthetase beta chain
MPDLLFEIGTEETPANAVLPALAQMESMMKDGLERLRLSHGGINTYATPRRLAILVHDLPAGQPDREVEYKGPPAERAFTEDGDATPAAFGFAKARGVDVNQLDVRSDNTGTFVWATVREEGHPAEEVLPGLLAEIITGLNFPITMRWGDLDFRFVRPIRWLVALFGDQVLPVEIANIKSGRHTRGHRALGPQEVELQAPGDYLSALKKAHVVADHRLRKQLIVEQATELAAQVDGTPVLHEQIVEENNFLVEWPLCVTCSFDQRYLEVPDEVLAMVMEKHQAYFPIAAESGSLMSKFIVVANSGPAATEMVRVGNEKVIEARLSDAEFYIREDTRISPEQALEHLHRVTFLEDLGTLYDKIVRLQVLVKWLAERVGADDDEMGVAQRAALLSKSDQVTQMVGDTKLAGLQGTIGAHYALVAGESQAVADAIAEQYLPIAADGALPSTMPGALLAVADKLDNLAAAYYIGAEPTGTRDPMGLRRQAQGMIAICLDRKLHFSLDDVVSLDMGLLPDLPDHDADDINRAGRRVKQFMAGRVEHHLQSLGINYDVIRAVLAGHWHDVVEVTERAVALARIRHEDSEFAATVDTATRPANIVRSSGLAAEAKVNSALFADPLEQQLWEAYQAAASRMSAALSGKRDYDEAWEALKSLSKPIDDYFVTVMVNAEDETVRTNRLTVMRALDRLYMNLADFTEIVQ